MADGAKIIVNNGATFDYYGTTNDRPLIKACEGMWDGIVVSGLRFDGKAAEVKMKYASLLNATNGITSNDYGHIDLQSCVFQSNNCVLNIGNIDPNTVVTFQDNDITNSPLTDPATSVDYYPDHAIVLSNGYNENINIHLNRFGGNYEYASGNILINQFGGINITNNEFREFNTIVNYPGGGHSVPSSPARMTTAIEISVELHL